MTTFRATPLWCAHFWIMSAGLCAILVSPATWSLPLDAKLVASGFQSPTFLTAPASDSRLFVGELSGKIKVFSGGQWSTFLDISAQVGIGGERGLSGFTFDPNFSVKGAPGQGSFYVDYTDRTTLNTKVERFTVSSNPNVANPAGTTLLTISQPPGSDTHKGGWMGFRPGDPNNLYIAVGDGGCCNDPGNRGQNTNGLLGKILRINVRTDEFPSDPSRNYAVPTANPFAAGGGAAEVWAYGLRNPFRDSFDHTTGDFYIADVGQDTREEVNFESASSKGGVNYGWRLREGTIATPTGGVGGIAPGAQDPFYDYVHGTGPFQGVAVIGGYVYRGSLLGDLYGAYLFGDFAGHIWSLRVDPATGNLIPGSLVSRTDELNPLHAFLSSFGEDGFGNLYIVDFDGKVFQVVPEPSGVIIMIAGLVALLWLARREPSYRQAGISAWSAQAIA